MDQTKNKVDSNDDASADINDNSEWDDGSATTSNQGGSQDIVRGLNDGERKIELSKNETLAVLRIRVFVFLVLLLASVAVSLTVYMITKRSVMDEYESQYEAAAKKVIEAFLDIAESKVAALSSLCVAVTALGTDQAQEWPFVTLSNFQQRASIARSQSGALDIQISPLVLDAQRADWENYTVHQNEWIREGVEYQDDIGLYGFFQESNSTFISQASETPNGIWHYNDAEHKVVDPGPGPYLPVWQTSPIFQHGKRANENLKHLNLTKSPWQAFETAHLIISEFISAPRGYMNSQHHNTAVFSLLLSVAHKQVMEYLGEPMSLVSYPLFDSLREDRQAVGVMVAWIHWMSYFESILPDTAHGIVVVLSDSCGGMYTMEIMGEQVFFHGEGDLHDRAFEDMHREARFQEDQIINDGTKNGVPLNQEECNIVLNVYPSRLFYDEYNDKTYVVVTVAVAIVFVFTAFTFLLYDRLVEHRQMLVLQKAIQSTQIVNTLFPETVREKMFQTNNDGQHNRKSNSAFSNTIRMLGGNFDKGTCAEDDPLLSSSALEQPNADLFPHCTVFFADIAGFTAWSSSREPTQVFVLLQTLYHAFDQIAKRRMVFKVETIGDSYVAATGLPQAQPNHAVIMARFATDCMIKMKELVSQLEKTLGPDTADLAMRVGLHSGPVTAGVLQGDRARFQLFGDTVNTAARMESNGVRDKIQVSLETHEYLVAAGKGYWTRPREDAINAKGKGTLQTYWLDINFKRTSITTEFNSVDRGSDLALANAPAGSSGIATEPTVTPDVLEISASKQDRLIDWMAELLGEHIKEMMLARKWQSTPYQLLPKDDVTALDKVADVLQFPRRGSMHSSSMTSLRGVEIEPDVALQLRQYVTLIASTYPQNEFHNFERACQVTMAASKYIKRMAATRDAKSMKKLGVLSYTDGIDSDPLVILAILFSAFVQDVDHNGVSYLRLCVKESEWNIFSQGASKIAQENSLHLAWNLLISERFSALQRCMFASETELKRFRQLMVNMSAATHSLDQKSSNERKERWNRAFSDESSSAADDPTINDLRATAMIECIIQASDVAHTMQHWQVYLKWNKLLFQETYHAYKAGEVSRNPSDFWYMGQLHYFDSYVIPLANKLKVCNAFGVLSDGCLTYAVKNRREWESRGQELVIQMAAEVEVEAELHGDPVTVPP